MKTFLKILGFLGLLVSIPMVLASVVDLVQGTSNAKGAIIGGAFFFFVALGCALALRKAYRRQDLVDRPSAFEMEQAILRLASRSRGRLTVAEVAASCGLTLDESEGALKKMVGQGAADLQVAESGALVYCFSGFIPQEEKERAEEVL